MSTPSSRKSLHCFSDPALSIGIRRTAVSFGALLAWVSSAQSFAVRDDWTQNIRVGAQMSMHVHAKFSLDGLISSGAGNPGQPGVPGQNHFYDDGYVRVDETGNTSGLTSYWGYADASQYDPATGQLVYHNTRGFRAENEADAGSGVRLGLDASYGSRLYDWQRLRLGWEIGYSYVPLKLREQGSIPATFERLVHAYDLGGVTLPTAPYQGGASGLGPVIPDMALARPDEILEGTLTGSRSLEVSLHSLRLGPTLFWRFYRQWALSGAIGPAVGLVRGGYHYDESFLFDNGATASYSGEDQQMSFVYGGYASATVLYRVVVDADLFLSAQFLSLGHVHYGEGGRRADLNLGQTVLVSAGINWPF